MSQTGPTDASSANGSPEDYDLVILGGGLAGSTLALHCRQEIPAARIAVLEKNTLPVPEAAFKVGESTVEVAAFYFTKVLGLEEHILSEQLPKNGLRFFFPAGDNRAIERRLEIGGTELPPTPSYQLDRGRFENYLAERCGEQGVDYIDGVTVKEVKLGRGRRHHEVTIADAGRHRSLGSRWVADASGRAGILKRQLDLARPSPHQANAAWFRVKARIKIDDWSQDAAWRKKNQWPSARWISTNHLLGEGYWVWLIPLASGSTSIGIVADPRLHPLAEFNSLAKAMAWLRRNEPQCAEQIDAQEAEVQDFLAIKQYSMKCKQVFSARRWGIVGDAGFFLDPFYSPGSDFIAIGNTFLSELIRRDLAGQSNRLPAPLFDQLYKTFFRGTLTVFEDQYPLFGNHQVMPVKILWDWMVYWTLTGFHFMHGRTCRLSGYARHLWKLKRLNELNASMQKFFRVWHEQSTPREVGGTIDTSAIPLITDTNRSLQDELDDRQFAERFAQNVEQMEALYWEIVDLSGIRYALPLKRRRCASARKDSFRPIFDVATAGEDPSAVSGRARQQVAAGHPS